jgi:hypothetical protein
MNKKGAALNCWKVLGKESADIHRSPQTRTRIGPTASATRIEVPAGVPAAIHPSPARCANPSD